MKKVLLSLAAVGTALSANAQLLNYGFETSDVLPGTAKIVAENWDDPESEAWKTNFYTLPAEGMGVKGSNALYAATDNAVGAWQRVIAFTNLGVQENKSYRISMDVKGEGSFNVAMLKGCFNHDLALQAGTAEAKVNQTKDFTISGSKFKKINYVVWSPSREIMQSAKEDFASDSIWALDFLRLSFNGIGNYTVDNVKVEESSVQGISFCDDVILVDFGYATNAKDLATAANGTFSFDPATIKVTEDGEELAVEAVEIKSNGQFCIFLAEDELDDKSGEIKVSFTNPGDLKYSSSVAPECFTNPNTTVYSFEAEVAYYDEEMPEYTAKAYEEAKLVSANPADDSFELDNNLTSFSFTFDKGVKNNAKAVLEGSNFKEELTIESFEGLQETITFKRAAGALANGSYSISLTNVTNAKGTKNFKPIVVAYDFGKVELNRTTYTKIETNTLVSCLEGNYPMGWTTRFDKGIDSTTMEPNIETRVYTEGGSYGGSRGFALTNSETAGAVYLRWLNWATSEGFPSITYGDMEGYELNLPAGDIELRVFETGWDGNGGDMMVTIYKDNLNGEVVRTKTFSVASGNNSRDGRTFQKDTVRFNTTGGKFVLKYEFASREKFGAVLFGGFEAYTYSGGEGGPQNTIFLEKMFANTANNAAPEYGSGWRLYQDGNMKNPGQDYNYNGIRIFTDLAYKNLNRGFYDNNANNYAIYGQGLTYTQDEEEKTEPVLALPATQLHIVYYIANWKGNSLNYTFQILDRASGDVVYERTDDCTVVANGDRYTTSIEAKKVDFDWKCPSIGEYMIKIFVNGEGFFGNMLIEKIADRASQFKNDLADKLDEANAELALANANDDFAGTTRDALDKAIKDYTNPDFHTKKEYTDAIADLDALMKKMQARRANVTAYVTGSMGKLVDYVAADSTNTYAELELMISAKEVIAKYDGVAVTSLDDDQLAAAVAEIEAAYNLLVNMIEKGIGLLTKQVKDLAAKLVYLNSDMDVNETVIAAQSVTSDDQTLAMKLKKYSVAYLYKKIADGWNFGYMDEVEEVFINETFDATSWMQNQGFYTTSPVSGVDAFPGWNVELATGTLTHSWDAGWDAYAGSATAPIQDAIFKTGYGDIDVTVSQKVEFLPVGTYTLKVLVCDETGVGEVMDGGNFVELSFDDTNYSSTINHTEGENLVETPMDRSGMGRWRAAGTHTETFSLPADAESNYATSTIGAHLNVKGGRGTIDNFQLVMTGKDAEFNYGAAVDAIVEDANGLVEVMERNDAPIKVTYYNLAGQHTAAPQGVSVKVELYKDGYTVVKKVMVK